MSIEADDEAIAIGCTFRWKIQNISICWLKRGKRIESPAFIVDSLENTKWSLQFYPKGETIYNRVGFYLHREKDSEGPNVIIVSYQLAIMGNNDSFLTERTVLECEFEKDERDGFEDYTKRDLVFYNGREIFLPNDTLTVQCMIWYKEDKPILQQHFFARTIYNKNRKSFIWKVENFSCLKFSPVKRFKHDLIEFDLFLCEELDVHKLLILSINLLNERLKYFSFKVSIVDNEGKKEIYRPIECFPDKLKKGKIPIVLFNNMIIENKNRYYPNDILILDCEYNMPTESAFNVFLASDRIGEELKNEVVDSRNENYMFKETLLSDLKFMFNDAIFSDIEIRTSSRSFPAHKAILSARSPVFRSMFSHDMKEKNSGHIDIIDFNEDTVHQMLLFLYTGSLEDLQFESAVMLYGIADKYDILSLKSECSAFLKDNLSITNVFNILILADLHNDKELKNDAEDYILIQRDEIFGLEEWKHFMDRHLKLAADVMHRKILEREYNL